MTHDNLVITKELLLVVLLVSCLPKYKITDLKIFRKHGIIYQEQLLFSKGKITNDHCFILKILIDKLTQKESKLVYTCFEELMIVKIIHDCFINLV